MEVRAAMKKATTVPGPALYLPTSPLKIYTPAPTHKQ